MSRVLALIFVLAIASAAASTPSACDKCKKSCAIVSGENTPLYHQCVKMCYSCNLPEALSYSLADANCNDDFKSSDSCAAASGCVWCKSAAVPSACYTQEQAASLPSSVFQCGAKLTLKDVDCNSDFKDVDSCNAASSCSWCKSAAVPSACYSLDQAKGLPSSVFQCSKLAKATDCNSAYKDSTSCNAADGCSWCKSAAVPSACYTEEQAKGLPSSVFQCTFKSRLSDLVKLLKPVSACENCTPCEKCKYSCSRVSKEGTPAYEMCAKMCGVCHQTAQPVVAAPVSDCDKCKKSCMGMSTCMSMCAACKKAYL